MFSLGFVDFLVQRNLTVNHLHGGVLDGIRHDAKEVCGRAPPGEQYRLHLVLYLTQKPGL